MACVTIRLRRYLFFLVHYFSIVLCRLLLHTNVCSFSFVFSLFFFVVIIFLFRCTSFFHSYLSRSFLLVRYLPFIFLVIKFLFGIYRQFYFTPCLLLVPSCSYISNSTFFVVQFLFIFSSLFFLVDIFSFRSFVFVLFFYIFLLCSFKFILSDYNLQSNVFYSFLLIYPFSFVIIRSFFRVDNFFLALSSTLFLIFIILHLCHTFFTIVFVSLLFLVPSFLFVLSYQVLLIHISSFRSHFFSLISLQFFHVRS